MNTSLKTLSSKLSSILTGAEQYLGVIFIVVVCAVYGFLAYRINSLTQSEPDPLQVTEKLQTVPRPRVDQSAIDKMKALEEENIEVKTLFEEARRNPFSE